MTSAGGWGHRKGGLFHVNLCQILIDEVKNTQSFEDVIYEWIPGSEIEVVVNVDVLGDEIGCEDGQFALMEEIQVGTET